MVLTKMVLILTHTWKIIHKTIFYKNKTYFFTCIRSPLTNDNDNFLINMIFLAKFFIIKSIVKHHIDIAG